MIPFHRSQTENSDSHVHNSIWGQEVACIISLYKDKRTQTRYHSSAALLSYCASLIQSLMQDYPLRLLIQAGEGSNCPPSSKKRMVLACCRVYRAPPFFIHVQALTPVTLCVSLTVHLSFPQIHEEQLFLVTQHESHYTQAPTRIHLFLFVSMSTTILEGLFRTQTGCCQQQQQRTQWKGNEPRTDENPMLLGLWNTSTTTAPMQSKAQLNCQCQLHHWKAFIDIIIIIINSLPSNQSGHQRIKSFSYHLEPNLQLSRCTN